MYRRCSLCGLMIALLGVAAPFSVTSAVDPPRSAAGSPNDQDPRPSSPAPKAGPVKATEPSKPADNVQLSGPKDGMRTLSLPGLTMSVPEAWLLEDLASGPMGPQAVLRLPKVEGDAEDGSIRITHFPNMKGKQMDEMNINRWIGQVTQADGRASTRADAKITVSELGPVRITLVDLSGSIKVTGSDTPRPNGRLLAAIVDHPKGPHFVVAVGGAKSMEKWAGPIEAFLKSAKAE